MYAGCDNPTKAGRRALSPKDLVDQAEEGFQASPPSCDLFNSLAILGRLSPQFRRGPSSHINDQTALPMRSNHIRNCNANHCASSVLAISPTTNLLTLHNTAPMHLRHGTLNCQAELKEHWVSKCHAWERNLGWEDRRSIIPNHPSSDRDAR
jgi:hypothetical protein